MSRRALTFLLVFCLVTLLGPPPVTRVTGALQDFDLGLAVDTALASNSYLAMAEVKVHEAKLAWDQARELADGIPEDAVNSYEVAVAKYLYPYQAMVGYHLALQGERAARADLRVQVEAAFYGLLRAESFRGLAVEALKRADEGVELARRAVSAGLAPARDVQEAELRRAECEVNLIAAENGVALARMALNRLLGRPLTAPIVAKGEFAFRPIGQVNLSEHVELAQTRRFEVYRAGRTVDIRRMDVALAQSLPSRAPVGLPGRWPSLPGDPPGEGGWLEWFLEYLRGIAPPEGQDNPYALPRASLALREAELALQLAREQVAFEVHHAYLRMLETEHKVGFCRLAVEEAAKTLKLARLRYEAGLGSSLEVSAAELSLTQAEVRYLDALYDHGLARTLFFHSSGEGNRVELPSTGR